ncbi:coiled-coil domain-containing protein 14 [Bombina bombina]|uniref:coiled-coil domain-containing protein 14 n=1 Tax=Bombina bombina TaxID=8345 RepID=UPI00235B23A5|nr:coiled-coil domain-containing protein 14 [Bombina bombina]
MARAGVRPGKVLSSGRLTGPVRLTNNKKRTAVRKISSSSVDSGYSLYSTDSEDQVLVINKGLDRCAALLQDILQNDVKDTVQQNSNKTPKVNIIRPTASKVKKSFPRKPTTSNHVHKDIDDGEALRLITELEHSVSLLPAVVGSTNVHAEIALALQPLRSENAQLRRRLRILNQQLRDRERAEKALRSDDQDLELTSLQSMNETLQHQLEESHRGLESLQSKNEELLKIIDSQKEENRKFARRIQEKEQELLQIHQQNDIAATKAKLDIDETLGKIKSVEFKLEASEKENQILGITLRQRDAEVSRLRDLTRTLQNSMAKLLSDLSKDSSKCISGNSLTKAVLGCYEKQLQDDQCPASTSIMSYLKKLETDQVFPGASTVFSEQFIPSKAASKCVTSEPSEDLAINKGPGVLDKNAGHQSFAVCNQLPPYSPHKRKTAAVSDSGTLIGDEFKPDETTYLPLTSSPFKGQFVTSQRQVCTPPKADTASRACNPNLSPAKVSEDKVSGNSQASSDGGLKTVGLKVTSDWSIRPHEGVSTREQCPINGTSTNVPSEMCPSVIQQIKSSNFSSVDFMSGKSDWSMSSFSTFTSHDEQDFRNGLAALDANIAKLQRTLQMDIIKK